MKLRGFRAISQSFALIPRDMSLASPTISLSLPLSHFLVQRDETRLDETRHASTAGVTHFHSIIVRSCSRFGKFAPAKSRSNLSLSLSATRTKRIDRSIHLEYRTNRNIGKGSGWMENWLSESWTDFPLCIYSLFLSPLAGFSLRFNDRLTESLCLSPLSLSVPRFHVLSLLAQFGKSDISIELVHSPSYLEMERGWGEGRRSRAERKIARFAFPFFPLSFTSPTCSYLLLEFLLSSSPSPPFRRLARIVSELSRVAKFSPSFLPSYLAGFQTTIY